jgi:hypothetical protein
MLGINCDKAAAEHFLDAINSSYFASGCSATRGRAPTSN